MTEKDQPQDFGTAHRPFDRADSSSEIKRDSKGRTETRGIFAAEDVTDVRNKQIIIVTGSWASAALYS